MKTLDFYDPEAADLLIQGGIVAFPTETVFGLGVRSDRASSYEELVRVKRRPPQKPFTLMGGDKMDLHLYAEVTPEIERVIRAFMPGPLTLLLEAKKGLPDYLTLGGGKIGIRISGDKRVRDLIDKVGVPLLVPSANRSKEPPALCEEEVRMIFQEEIPAVIRGACKGGCPSAIFDLSKPGSLVEVRGGEISLQQIKEVYYDKDCDRQ